MDEDRVTLTDEDRQLIEDWLSDPDPRVRRWGCPWYEFGCKAACAESPDAFCEVIFDNRPLGHCPCDWLGSWKVLQRLADLNFDVSKWQIELQCKEAEYGGC